MTDKTQESHREKLKRFDYQGMVVTESQSAEIIEQPEARPGKLYAQMKMDRVQCSNHANSGKTFRNRWTSRMVKRLCEVRTRVEGFGTRCQSVKGGKETNR